MPSRSSPPVAVEQPGQLLERAPERAARARGVLEVQRAVLGLGERLAQHDARACNGRGRIAALGRARVQHDGVGSDGGADAQRVGHRRKRLRADLLILAGAVDQVDRVDQDGLDVRVGERRPECGEVLVAVGRRAPLARRLVEDLDGTTFALDATCNRVGQTAGGGDMGADQHVGRR